MLRLWKGFSGTSLPARQPQPLITFIAWSVPVINGGLLHRRQCELVTLKPVLYYCIFDRMVLKTVLQGLMWQIYLFMQKEVFFFFFQEVWLIMHSSSRALKLHGLKKVDAKRERNKQNKKKKKTSKMFTKKLKQMSSACSISQSLLSSVVNMFQMTFSWKKKISLQHCRMWGVTSSQE